MLSVLTCSCLDCLLCQIIIVLRWQCCTVFVQAVVIAGHEQFQLKCGFVGSNKAGIVQLDRDKLNKTYLQA